MSSTAQATIRNVGFLLIQRGGIVISVMAYAALIPRLMGPTTYGQFILLSSLALWISNGSALGITPMMGRFVPEFLSRDDKIGLLKFVGQMAATRILLGGIGATLYFILTKLWLQNLDWVVLGFMALSVFFNIISLFFFNLFLGLNQAANWVMNETLKCWGSLILVLAGVWFWGLKGACLGLALTDLMVLGVGWRWGRAYLGQNFSWPEIRYLAPFFRFGLIFFAVDIILSTLHYSGATLIKVINQDYNQVSYFGLAYQGYILSAASLGKMALAFAPFLTGLMARHETAALKNWVEQLLKWHAISGILIVFGALFLADPVIPWLIGESFRPVALNLVIMTLSLLPFGVASVGGALTIIKDRPGLTLRASVLRLIGFLVAGGVMIAWLGSLGASLAVIVGGVVQAVYYISRWHELVPVSWRSWLLSLGLGAMFLPLVWLKSSWTINLGLFTVAVVGYAGVLLLFGLVTPGGLAMAWRALVSGQVHQDSSHWKEL
jgi:O-antigen/teichoic acid export membrane protein